MSAYLSAAHQLLQKFQAYEIRQIPRSENSHADALLHLASAINDRIGRKVPVEILSQPSTTTAEVCTVRYKDTWMSPIYAFITNGTLPTDKSQARKLRYRSARYIVIDDVLGTTSFGKSTAGSAVTIQGPGRWHTKSFGKGISGRPYTKMQTC
ncbi:unnamed protein product [Prunus armeniaca]